MKGTLADFRKINFLRVQPHLFATLCGCASLPATHPCNFQAIPRSDGEVMTEKRPVSPTAAPFRALLAPHRPPSAAPATRRPQRHSHRDVSPRHSSKRQPPRVFPPHTAALAPSAAQRQHPTSRLAYSAARTAMWRPVAAPNASHPESFPALIYTAAPTPPAAHHLQPTPLDAPRHIAVLHRPDPKLLRRLSSCDAFPCLCAVSRAAPGGDSFAGPAPRPARKGGLSFRAHPLPPRFCMQMPPALSVAGTQRCGPPEYCPLSPAQTIP